MAQHIVRNVAPAIVRELKLRAARRGQSAEAEHREILLDAVAARPRQRGLKELLESMPSAGRDSDFERPRDIGRRTRL